MEDFVPMSNIRFLNVCYIITFGLIFTNKNLINTYEQDKIVPNALLRYSNDSNNTTDAKIQPSMEINKTNKTTNTTFSLLKNIPLEHISKTQNSPLSEKGSPQVIEKFSNYVCPVLEAGTKGEEKKLRVKRQPIGRKDVLYMDYENNEESSKTINDDAVVDNNTQTFSGETIDESSWGENKFLGLQRDQQPGSRDQQPDRAVDLKRKHDNDPKIKPKISKIDTKDSSSDDEPLDMEKNQLNSTTFIHKIIHRIEKKGKTQRMHFIEKAAFYISNNCNETFENSVGMLKNYILSFKTCSVPTYDELAEDFCKNKTIPEKYNKLRIPRHPLIDDVLYQLNLDDISEVVARGKLRHILRRYNKTMIAGCFKIYNDSAIIKKYLRIEDFLLIRLNLRTYGIKLYRRKKPIIQRVTVALYRLALRQLEIDSDDGNDNITLYGYKYIRYVDKIERNFINHNHYEAVNFPEFTQNIESEIRTLEEGYSKSREKRLLMIQIQSLKPPAIPNIGVVFPEEENEIFIILPKTNFTIIEKRNVSAYGHSGFAIKLKDRRLKEEKMIDIMNKIYHHLVSYPQFYDIYNVKNLKKMEVVSPRNNQPITRMTFPSYQNLEKAIITANLKYDDEINIQDEEQFDDANMNFNDSKLEQSIQVSLSKNEKDNIDSGNQSHWHKDIRNRQFDSNNAFIHKIARNGQTERMHFIEKAAFYIIHNSNETFENSIDMLKNYILSFKTCSVPTYDELAKDFCKNKTIPEKYNKWRIARHKLIDDVLYQLNLDDISETEARDTLNYILRQYNKTMITGCFKIYNDSAIIKKYLRIEDFLLIRLNLRKNGKKLHESKIPKIRRVTVSLYRLALRQLEIDSDDSNDITLYGYKFGYLNTKEKKAIKLNYYTAFDFPEFTPNLDLMMKILEEKYNESVKKNPKLIQIESLKPPAIPNIGFVFPEEENEIFIIPQQTNFPIVDYTTIYLKASRGLLLKLEDKRLKEEKMIDIINKINHHLVSFPELYNIYNVKNLNKMEVVTPRNNQPISRFTFPSYQNLEETIVTANPKYDDKINIQDEEQFDEFSEETDTTKRRQELFADFILSHSDKYRTDEVPEEWQILRQKLLPPIEYFVHMRGDNKEELNDTATLEVEDKTFSTDRTFSLIEHNPNIQGDNNEELDNAHLNSEVATVSEIQPNPHDIDSNENLRDEVQQLLDNLLNESDDEPLDINANTANENIHPPDNDHDLNENAEKEWKQHIRDIKSSAINQPIELTDEEWKLYQLIEGNLYKAEPQNDPLDKDKY